MLKEIVKLVLFAMVFATISSAWEVNTHRLIDRKAVEVSNNLKKFLTDAKIDPDAKFEDKYLRYYDTTYFDYITFNKKDNGISYNSAMAEIPLEFEEHDYKDIIEAGSILEDATFWSTGLGGINGRFLYHFLNHQDGDDGYLRFGNALQWAKGKTGTNGYSLSWAHNHFFWAFQNYNKDDRKRELGSMLVSIGHLMHLFNDMNVPAHTRGDSHPAGDPLELWMRGGEHHNGSTGFYILKSTPAGELQDLTAEPNHFTDFETNFISEARRTSEEFLSKDAMFDEWPLPSLEGVDTPNPASCGEYTYATKNGIKLAVIRKSYLWGYNNVYFIDDSKVSNPVHRSYGKVLIPRAIANAAGFLNYFFRGSMKVNSTGEVVSIMNDSDKNLVAEGVATFKNGTLKFYCDDKNDNRSEFHSENIVEVTSGNELASVAKDTLYTEFQSKGCEKENKVTILYDGTIGSERGLSVIVIPASDIIPSNDGGGDDSNGDNTGGDSDNGTGADNGDSSDNGDDTTDPTKDPNKVCVSNFFDYGNGQIIEDLKKGDKDAYNENTGEGYSDGTKHQVKELQEFLEAFGYDVGSSGADGWFGGDTKTALINFQDANGLDADGIVGPNTRDAMNSQNCYDK